MSDKRRSVDERVDEFVKAANACAHEPHPADEVPPACKTSEYHWTGWFNWRIVPSAEAHWLAPLEQRLPFPIPPTFRSLISRYVFPSFKAGPLTFYSAGVEGPGAEFVEYQYAAFGDGNLAPLLLENGLEPFARPADGSYDPVCFDFRTSRNKKDPAVVRVDHEEVLCNRRIRVVESISPGFDRLVEEITALLQKPGTKVG